MPTYAQPELVLAARMNIVIPHQPAVDRTSALKQTVVTPCNMLFLCYHNRLAVSWPADTHSAGYAEVDVHIEGSFTRGLAVNVL